MPRVKLTMPEKIHHSCEMTVRVTDMNYGAHLANDALLSLAHEARMQLLYHFGFKENDIGGFGLLVADAVIVYKAQARWGEVLNVNMSVTGFNKYGCDIYYHFINKKTNKEVARAKTHIVIFDFSEQEIVLMPDVFRQCFQ